LRNPERSIDSRIGIVAGLAAYGLWGLMPLYFTALSNVPAWEILAQRIIWCTGFLAILVTIAGRWPEVYQGLRSPKVLATFLFSSVLLSVNWITYIHGVVSKQTVETSLGFSSIRSSTSRSGSFSFASACDRCKSSLLPWPRWVF
jgi:chloramphenicol-sensitive protein RarD